MAGLLAYAAAGAAQGLGAGMVEDGKAKRERALKLLDQQHQLGRDEADRSFRSGESEKDRGFRAGESEKDRDFRAADSEETRRHQRGLLSNTEDFIDRDGLRWVRTPSGVKPLLGPDGKQLTGREASSEPLVEVGDDESPTGTRLVPRSQAAGMPGKSSKEVRGNARTDREDAEADARTQAQREADARAGWLSRDSSDFAEDGGDRDAFIKRRTEEILAEGKGGAPRQDTPAQKTLREKGQGSGAAPDQGGELLAAPRDPAQRKVGQVYVAPDGRKVEWTGAGWKLSK